MWQRGTDRTKHFPSSQKLWKLCADTGYIYKKTYTGLYCVGCEAFYTPDELNEHGECFEHPGKKLESVSEENYFFALSKLQKNIEDVLSTNALEIFPTIRKNEALGFVKKGLEDFSISRSRQRAKGWGIPVPGDNTQIMYVWFDALNIYQTGIGFGTDDARYTQLAPQDLMIIGKGIIRFHAIYWPAILMAAGLPLPKQLFVHGYLTVDGQKMSKTLGNVVDPVTVVQKFGTDPVRYYLLKEIPSFADGDYSDRRFTELYNSDLANGLGNVVSRVAKLASTVPEKFTIQAAHFQRLPFPEFHNHMQQYELNLAAADIWNHITKLDQLINNDKPWTLSGTALQKALITYINEYILPIACALQPFLPETAENILHHFQNERIVPFPPLFPRIK